MKFQLNETQVMIQDGARRMLASEFDSLQARAVEASDTGYSQKIWSRLSELRLELGRNFRSSRWRWPGCAGIVCAGRRNGPCSCLIPFARKLRCGLCVSQCT